MKPPGDEAHAFPPPPPASHLPPLRLAAAAFLAAALRLSQLHEPRTPVYDETHVGRFLLGYSDRAFFFDVHGPLAKLLIYATASARGFAGRASCAYASSAPYAQSCELAAQRLLPALCGAALVPLAMRTACVMGVHVRAAALVGWLLLTDSMCLCLSRLHLNDMVLMLFVALAHHAALSACAIPPPHAPPPRLPALCARLLPAALAVGCALQCKFAVALPTLGWLGLQNAWVLVGMAAHRRGARRVALEAAARAACLVCVPLALHLCCFALHLRFTPNSGDGGVCRSPSTSAASPSTSASRPTREMAVRAARPPPLLLRPPPLLLRPPPPLLRPPPLLLRPPPLLLRPPPLLLRPPPPLHAQLGRWRCVPLALHLCCFALHLRFTPNSGDGGACRSPSTSAASPSTSAASPSASAASPSTSAASPSTSAASPSTSAASPSTSASRPTREMAVCAARPPPLLLRPPPLLLRPPPPLLRPPPPLLRPPPLLLRPPPPLHAQLGRWRCVPLALHVCCFALHLRCFALHLCCFALHLRCFALHLCCFAFHLRFTPNSGDGDAYMSAAFQSTLRGNPHAAEAHTRAAAPGLLSMAWEHLTAQLRYHRNMAVVFPRGSHPSDTAWWSWPLAMRGVYFNLVPDVGALAASIHQPHRFGIFIHPNPFTVLLTTLASALVVCGVLCLTLATVCDKRRRSRRLASLVSSMQPGGALSLLCAYLMHWLPYATQRRQTFLFYYLPAYYFAILLTARALDFGLVSESPRVRRLSSLVVLLVCAATGVVGWKVCPPAAHTATTSSIRPIALGSPVLLNDWMAALQLASTECWFGRKCWVNP
ncbi:hypothetical protein AB1Y20_020857 [Prymnesium parvum]|uniref:Dolichyl-phosphate-mannose--protein mannosyltransferase n=1 Tax=Prymnesium parvum TaxID=97485 RepID=A0AB34JZB0_PRYPA